jgi:hypothetical protein
MKSFGVRSGGEVWRWFGERLDVLWKSPRDCTNVECDSRHPIFRVLVTQPAERDESLSVFKPMMLAAR